MSVWSGVSFKERLIVGDESGILVLPKLPRLGSGEGRGIAIIVVGSESVLTIEYWPRGLQIKLVVLLATLSVNCVMNCLLGIASFKSGLRLLLGDEFSIGLFSSGM